MIIFFVFYQIFPQRIFSENLFKTMYEIFLMTQEIKMLELFPNIALKKAVIS